MSPEIEAQTSTPLHEGGPSAKALATADGWNVNVHFVAGDEQRTYVFDTEQAEWFVESVQAALLHARQARP